MVYRTPLYCGLDHTWKGRLKRVAVGSVHSNSIQLNSGVPQVSVLGLRLYCMFSKPIAEICKRHNMLYHCYADDSQVYLVIEPIDSWTDISVRLEACIADISTWMKINLLKLNQDKTELIIFAPKHRVKELGNCQLVLDSDRCNMRAKPWCLLGQIVEYGTTHCSRV